MRLQHGVFGGFPSCTLIKPNTSAHTPNLIVSLGQLACFGEGGFGTGGCFGVLGGGLHGTYVELTTVKKRTLKHKRSAALEAISLWCWKLLTLTLVWCVRLQRISEGFIG